MNKFGCRIFQNVMRVAMYCMPWREPQVFTGENAVNEIPEIFLAKNINSVILITDRGVMENGLCQSTLDALKAAKIKCAVFDKTVANPSIDNIEEALKLFHKHHCQGIIAIGGGSPMDCAKGVGARVARPKKTISQMRGLLKVGRNMPTFVAVPTTAGTGSETTVAAIITDSKTKEKYAVNDPHLVPHFAILDPLLTLSLPPALTATTGMDALTHAVEAYIGKSPTKKTNRNAEEAVQIIFKYLPKAVKDGTDIEARSQMQRASFAAGLAFTRAYVGNVHSIAHTLGGQYGVPHGLANAVILPYVLEYYGASIYKKIARLCRKAGLFEDTLSPKEYTEKFIAHLKKLNKQFGIGTKIKELKEEDIPTLAQRAIRESNPLYPVPVIFNLDDFIKIFRQLLV